MQNQSTEKQISKYTPVYLPVSVKEPSEAEKRIDATLQQYMDLEMKLESDQEMIRRDSVLTEVKKIFIKWVHFVATEILRMPEDEEEDFGGELFLSGSHRLGVRDIGADIDTVCVAPNFCTREHFFTHLKDLFMHHPDVTELNAVEDAFVPVISFDFQGVSIDLLFARLSDNFIPKDIDILDDKILMGLDEATEKSLNGPRVTNMIFKLVGDKTFPNFLIVLRCIRRWAKKRGLYGNKLGYLGGVNFNILVAFVCQLYPNAGPSSLLSRFFKLFSDWNWPEPVMLNSIQQNSFDTQLSEQREIWSPLLYPHHLMPIITPAYPAMNSAVNVSIHTLEVMKQEFHQGFTTVKQIIDEKGKNWGKLFEISDFFIKYSHYLACHIIGTGNDSESRSWTGFVESRIRRFIPVLERLPLKKPIQLYPVLNKTQKSANSFCYFIGFNLDLERINLVMDKNIYIDDCVYRFQDSLWDPERGFKGVKKEGLDFQVEHLTWKKLPKEVFEPMGGKEIAKQRRIELGYATAKTSITTSAKKNSRSKSEIEASNGSIKNNVEINGTTTATVIENKDESKSDDVITVNNNKTDTKNGDEIMVNNDYKNETKSDDAITVNINEVVSSNVSNNNNNNNNSNNNNNNIENNNGTARTVITDSKIIEDDNDVITVNFDEVTKTKIEKIINSEVEDEQDLKKRKHSEDFSSNVMENNKQNNKQKVVIDVKNGFDSIKEEKNIIVDEKNFDKKSIPVINYTNPMWIPKKNYFVPNVTWSLLEK